MKVLSDDLSPTIATAPSPAGHDAAGRAITRRRVAFAAGFLVSLLLAGAFIVSALVLNHVRG